MLNRAEPTLSCRRISLHLKSLDQAQEQGIPRRIPLGGDRSREPPAYSPSRVTLACAKKGLETRPCQIYPDVRRLGSSGWYSAASPSAHLHSACPLSPALGKIHQSSYMIDEAVRNSNPVSRAGSETWYRGPLRV